MLFLPEGLFEGLSRSLKSISGFRGKLAGRNSERAD